MAETTLKKIKFDDDDYCSDSNSNSNHHYCIESAEKELMKAKHRVAELESIIEQLKKKNKEEPIVPEEEERSTNNTSFLHGDTLQVVLEWLGPKDLVSCGQVCRRWHQNIDRSPRVWKTAVENLSPPAFSKDISCILERGIKKKKTTESSSLPASSTSLNIEPFSSSSSELARRYKHVAMGLSSTTCATDKRRNQQPQHIAPKDVFILIEVKDKKSDKIIGTWHENLEKYDEGIHFVGRRIFGRSVDDNDDDDNDQKFILPKTLDQGTFEEHFGEGDEEQDPEEFAPKAIYESMVFTIRFFRGDTGRSFCWIFEKNVDRLHRDRIAYVRSAFAIPDGNTVAGASARAIWAQQGVRGIKISLLFKIKPVLPTNRFSDGLDPDFWRKIRYELCFIDCGHVTIGGRNDREVFDVAAETLLFMYSIDGLSWK